MYNKFLRYIKKENLFTSEDRVLIAASGGRDSMVLIDLMIRAKFDIGVAHFNHKTRNGESDRDQKFVEEYCKKKDLPFYTVSVDIKEMLGKEGSNNFQDLAREKRYEWLETVRKDNKYDLIATAHHKNDNIETFLFKISRGAGIKGLCGIRPKNGLVVRPMLGISDTELKKYIGENSILFVEDSSNLSDDYNRNFIRHNIVPQFEALHPNFINRISVTIDNINSIDKQFDFLLDAYSAKYICEKKGRIIISKNLLDKVSGKEDFLYFVLQKYGFNRSQALSIFKSIDSVGAIFEAFDFVLLVDRVSLIVKERRSIDKSEIEVYPGENILEGYGTLNLELVKNDNLKFDTKTKYLNPEKISFPLKVRRWNPGDRFAPFGLKGKTKKIKDYFINKKISRFDKEDALLLINDTEICMILGDDISYKYRVNKEMENVLKVEFLKKQ